jgi:hypothetical protein
LLNWLTKNESPGNLRPFGRHPCPTSSGVGINTGTTTRISNVIPAQAGIQRL